MSAPKWLTWLGPWRLVNGRWQRKYRYVPPAYVSATTSTTGEPWPRSYLALLTGDTASTVTWVSAVHYGPRALSSTPGCSPGRGESGEGVRGSAASLDAPLTTNSEKEGDR